MLKRKVVFVGTAAVATLAGQALAACPNPVAGPDVIVGAITGPSNYTVANGVDALSLGTTSCNMGDTLLRWDAFPAATHPAIAGNLYKFKTVNGSGRFEQIGQSWLKHGFTALAGNVCCTCTNPGTGTRLGLGCSDPYTSARNGSQGGLGPRWQVNAHTGVFPTSGPAQPTPNSGSTYRRLEVLVSDLEPSSATVKYFGESQYVSPDDAAAGNQNNNASYIAMTATGTTDFSFALGGATVRQQSAIRAWATCETGVTLTNVQVPNDGLFVVGSKATDLGGGVWHYEYAVYNMNSDRNGGSFSVPVPAGANITNVGFHGVTYRNGDATANTASSTVNFSNAAWTSTIGGGKLTWTTESEATNNRANAIRWGTTYNFRFDADVAPAATNGNVTLGLWKSGAVASVEGLAQIPGAGTVCMADIDNDGNFANGLNPDGGVTVDDLIAFLAGYEEGSVLIDLTNDEAVTIDDLIMFMTHFEGGC